MYDGESSSEEYGAFSSSQTFLDMLAYSEPIASRDTGIQCMIEPTLEQEELNLRKKVNRS
jgi:hypothetical protein